MPLLKNKKTSCKLSEKQSLLNKKRPLKEVGLFFLDILYNAVIIIVLVVLIRTFLISPFRVIGSSMADTLSNNEFILIDKLSYHLGVPQRGDPIVFLPPITNKYPHKFEESVTTDANGVGVLDISNLRTDKNIFYCQNSFMRALWLCKDRVNKNDLIFYRPLKDNEKGSIIDLSWKQAYKEKVTASEIKQKKVVISGEPNQAYLIRIYNSTGPEYFVKRIIGIPGDTVRIENGRVYLKEVGKDDFYELDEEYLSEENQFHTYFKKIAGMNELVVPDGQYFVLGDNRNHSNDSRHWYSPIEEDYTPYVKQEYISGRVMVVLWPPENLRLLDSGVLD